MTLQELSLDKVIALKSLGLYDLILTQSESRILADNHLVEVIFEGVTDLDISILEQNLDTTPIPILSKIEGNLLLKISDLEITRHNNRSTVKLDLLRF